MTRPSATLLALAATCLGCSGGDDPGADGVRIDGGVVGIYVSAGVTTLNAYFFSDLEPLPAPAQLDATDTCKLAGGGTAPPSPTYLDAGEDVRAISGATTLIAPREIDGAEITYIGTTTSGGTANTTYTVSVAGSAELAAGDIAQLSVPAVLTIPIPTINPGSALTLDWTPTGADVVILLLSDFDGSTAYDCRVVDDGSFTIAGAITDDIGADGDIYYLNSTFDTVEVNGRIVLLVGNTQGG